MVFGILKIVFGLVILIIGSGAAMPLSVVLGDGADATTNLLIKGTMAFLMLCGLGLVAAGLGQIVLSIGRSVKWLHRIFAGSRGAEERPGA